MSQEKKPASASKEKKPAGESKEKKPAAQSKEKRPPPPYQTVLFVDSTTGSEFLCGAAIKCDQTKSFEGKEYPCATVSISSASHPLFTGERNRFVDAEGRVKKFQRRYGTSAAMKQKEEQA